MTTIIGFFLTLTIAVLAGFGATWFIINKSHGFEAVSVGSWSTWPKAGSKDADPYTKAVIAITAEIPLQSEEGLIFITDKDDEDHKFKASCTYGISGSLPVSQLWTLTAYNDDGQIIKNIAERHSLMSNDIIYNDKNGFEIVVSSTIQPGNWLPIGPTEPFQLVLRLYDPSLGRTASEIKSAIALKNQKKSCR